MKEKDRRKKKKDRIVFGPERRDARVVRQEEKVASAVAQTNGQEAVLKLVGGSVLVPEVDNLALLAVIPELGFVSSWRQTVETVAQMEEQDLAGRQAGGPPLAAEADISNLGRAGIALPLSEQLGLACLFGGGIPVAKEERSLVFPAESGTVHSTGARKK